MSNKEQYKQAFSVLQSSVDELPLVEKQMAVIRKKAVFRSALAVAAAILMIIIVGGGTAYATNVGDIQKKFEMWLGGKFGTATFEYDGKGGVIVEYMDENGNRSILCDYVDPDHPEPLTYEEEKELIEDLYNDVKVEFFGGAVTLYFQDQVVDISDKFVDGICELYLKGANNYEVNITVERDTQTVSWSGMYDETPEADTEIGYAADPYADFKDDGTVILYFQDQIIDITDKFTDGICEIHVLGRPYGWFETIYLADQSSGGCSDRTEYELVTDEELARVEHRPVPSYRDEELSSGVLRMDDKGNTYIHPARFEGKKMAEYLGDEEKYKISDEAFFYLYPLEGYWGEAVTADYFMEYLSYHRMGCYFHLDEKGKIDYIRGIPNM